MRRRGCATLLLTLAACGGSSGPPASPSPAPAPSVLAVSAPIVAATPAPVQVTGTDFPGTPGDAVTLEFTAEDGLPLATCGTATLHAAGTLDSATSVSTTVPPFLLTRSVAARVRVRFPGGEEATSVASIATLVGVPDDAVDQDLDGVPDACDRRTYTFEGDAIGAAPAGMTSHDANLPSVVVRADASADRVAAFGPSPTSGYDRFDRLTADFPQQDLTIYLDVETAPTGWLTLETWCDGSYLGAAGSGVLLQVQTDGRIVYYERLWSSITRSVAGPLLPASGRLRLRLRKGAGVTSVLHVDAFVGGTWTDDHAVFAIPDDHAFRGLETMLTSYGGGSRGVKRITVVAEPPADVLAIAKSARVSSDWQVFQRGPGDVADVPLRVLFAHAGPVRLEARVVRSATGEALPGHDFGDHVRAAAPGDRGRVDWTVAGVPTGGNYDIHVRLVEDVPAGAVVAQRALHDVAVGDVWLAGGQSNTSGYSGTLFGAETPVAEVHAFHNDGAWRQAVEPMDDGVEQTDLVSREAPAASCLLAFGKVLFQRTGVPVAIVPGPLGGTNLYAQWQRNALRAHRGTLYGSLLHRARVASPARPPRGLLWFQGESDALAARTQVQYRADLERLIAQYRDDLASPSLVLLAGQLGTYQSANLALWLPVQEAQRQTVLSDPLAALATAVDLPRADAIHFNVAGYRTLGSRFAVGAARLVHGQPVDETTDLVRADVEPGGLAVLATYERDVSGGAASLFRVTDDLGAATVTGVTTSGPTVRVALDRTLATNVLLSYGWSVNPADAWVKDASQVPVACFTALPVAP